MSVILWWFAISLLAAFAWCRIAAAMRRQDLALIAYDDRKHYDPFDDIDRVLALTSHQAVLETLPDSMRDRLRLSGNTCPAPRRRVQGHLWAPAITKYIDRAAEKSWRCKECGQVCRTKEVAWETGSFYEPSDQDYAALRSGDTVDAQMLRQVERAIAEAHRLDNTRWLS